MYAGIHASSMSLVSNCSSNILLTSGEGSCEGLSLVPGGSIPDASSNDVACWRLHWRSSKYCLGEVSSNVDSSLVCYLLSPVIGNTSVVFLSILEFLDSIPRREDGR